MELVYGIFIQKAKAVHVDCADNDSLKWTDSLIRVYRITIHYLLCI